MINEFNEINKIPDNRVIPTDDGGYAKTIQAFIDDDKTALFHEVLQSFFSKHIILSFFSEKDIPILMLMFDNTLLYRTISTDMTSEDLIKYNQLRLLFFSMLKRAVGKMSNRENERTLLGKTISENIMVNPVQKQNPFSRFLFGNR